MADSQRPDIRRGIELAGALGAGKTCPLSAPPAGITGINTANFSSRIALGRFRPAAVIHLWPEQFISHPEGPVS